MLLDSLVDELASRVRVLPSGARSLGHLRVLVPTLASARRLREALSRRFGALVPPETLTPTRARLGDDPALATRTDALAAFHAAGLDFARAKELADLRLLLEPKALLFADVAEAIAADLPDEAERWRELAAIEKKYLAALEAKGKRDRLVALKTSAPRPGDEIEEELDWSDLASLIARYGRLPASRPALVERARVVPTATPADEAARLADFFARVKPNEAYPALSVVDPALFPEILTAFKARGLIVRNPAETRLTTSSLGHLVDEIVSLLRTPSYAVFSAFIRGGDVRRWLKAELNLTEEKLVAALVDLDNRQAEYLPETIDDIAPKTHGALRAIFELVKVALRKKTLRQILGEIFKDLILDERDDSAREFAAAAEVVSALISECEVWGRETFAELFALRLEEATYSLESDEGELVLSEGWLELPFLSADEVVVAGFREGCVPESTVGHPYLPDALRTRLGLADNAFKEARDRACLALLTASRAPEKVTIFYHAIDAKGDVVKPSRLLFETADDEDLLARVRSFYALKAGSAEGVASDLPAAWKLALPIPPAFRELSKISPTRLDSYKRCPFTFYLKDKAILGERRLNDRAEELASWEYGNLAHDALEAFGLSERKDSTDPAEIRAFLEAEVDERLVARFGLAIPAIVAMQGESVKRRLADFAEIQAARRRAGWRIVAVERRMEVVYDHTRLYGKCDRIDFNETTKRWAIIDYKTWDSAEKTKPALQLPLYCAMLDADSSPEFAAAKLDSIEASYCILGKTAADVVFTEPLNGGYVPEAENEARRLIARIEKGVFWPPSVPAEWKYDYEDWLSPGPEKTVDEKWIADQVRRLAAVEEESRGS